MTDDDETSKARGTNGKGGSNGAGHAATSEAPTPAESALLAAPPPPAVQDLADACVRFVERAVGVRLDYTLETLPLLDHYLAAARETLGEKKKAAESQAGSEQDATPTLSIVAQAAGAYFGEVIRRRHASWWRLDADPADHRLEFHHLHLVVLPVTLMLDVLTLDPAGKGPASFSGFELDEADRGAAAARLAELPPVPLEEYVSPSTRLEVIDIVVDAVRVFHMAEGIPVQALEPDDYLDA
jgi:hypothetical protein